MERIVVTNSNDALVREISLAPLASAVQVKKGLYELLAAHVARHSSMIFV